ncbi:MAG: FixH family protein [Bdellovibrionaceae bacterium]|nr:FixH family protein [Pseudobdellovibrionaceae bacterium]MDW8189410.1 hypothetical protein [Pseudobdellovibrionaceae bacterium]
MRFPSGQECVTWQWIKKPNHSEYGSLLIKMFRLNRFDQSPVLLESTNSFVLELWMPSMNHGSSPTTVTKVDIGTYLVEQVFFIMPGDWELRWHKMQPETNQILETLTLPVFISDEEFNQSSF